MVLEIVTLFTSSHWCLGHKVRNQLAHAGNGNGVDNITRTKWESTPTLPGIALAGSDELELRAEGMVTHLRADQVARNAEGIALCKTLHLASKLKVKAGLILP